MIAHKSEFGPETIPPRNTGRELAAAYVRTFESADGKRVLADLLAKFDPLRPRFQGHSDATIAAKIDGQADVLREILQAIKAATPTPT